MMEAQHTDILRRKPGWAVAILVAGAAAYWFLCEPAIGRRGYPEIDPFWLAMPKLWILPIILSAWWDDRRTRRFVHLALYALITGFIGSGTIVTLIPNRISYSGMLLRTIFWGPFHFVIALLLEHFSQRLLRCWRRFDDAPRCAKCGYHLIYLTKPRCPECGETFDLALLNSTSASEAVDHRSRRVLAFNVILLAGGIAFPFIFHFACLQYASFRGRTTARTDWESGSAVWYVTDEEYIEMIHDDTQDGDQHAWSLTYRNMNVQGMHGGIEREMFMRAYRSVIEAELRAEGPEN